MVFNGIDKYFDVLQDDVFIVFNQDLFNDCKNKHLEKDAIVINLKKGYIIAANNQATSAGICPCAYSGNTQLSKHKHANMQGKA